MYGPGAGIEAGAVIPEETHPTFPVPADAAAERALRRDLVLLTAQLRPRRRARPR